MTAGLVSALVVVLGLGGQWVSEETALESKCVW